MEYTKFQDSNGFFGLKDENEITIVPSVYTNLELSSEYIFVSVGDKIGVLNKKGQTIIPTVCKTIVGDYILDKANNRPHYQWEEYTILDALKSCGLKRNVKYDFYKEFITSSDNKVWKYVLNYKNIETECYSNIKWDLPLILCVGEKDIIYKLNEGYISRPYSKVIQIEHNLYVVELDSKFGLYNANKQKEIISVDADCIKYQGGDYIFVEHDGIWSIYTINEGNKLFDIEFTEIFYLNDTYKYFLGRIVEKDYKDKTITRYGIFDLSGTDLSRIYKYEEYHSYNDKFIYINDDFIIAENQNKYGAININGLAVVPFKYDSIKRIWEDSFLVQIENRYGMINSNGVELIPITFEKPDLSGNYLILKDVYSNRYGAYTIEGKMLLPHIYKFITADCDIYENINYLYASFIGYKEDDEYRNFFSYNVFHGAWKCFDSNGKLLIDKEYDCYRKENKYIIAGYGGDFVEGISCYELDQYTGKYDLYDSTGNFLIGGFRDYNIKDGYILLFFGGEWECNRVGDYSVYDYSLNYDGYWMLLDEKINSLIVYESIHECLRGQHVQDITEYCGCFEFPDWNENVQFPENDVIRIKWMSYGIVDYNIRTHEYKEVEISDDEDDCQDSYGADSYSSAYENPYYNDKLDFDQQSQEFWESL